VKAAYKETTQAVIYGRDLLRGQRYPKNKGARESVAIDVMGEEERDMRI
jgi:hypothetical protein